MISQELLDEVIFESLKGKYISKGLITRIAISVIEQCDDITKSLFKELKFVKDLGDTTLANCNYETGIIKFCYSKNKEEVLKIKKFTFLKANLEIIQTILHEIEHLKEKYKISKGDFKSKLIINCDTEVIFNILKENFEMKNHRKYRYENRTNAILDENYSEFEDKNWSILPPEKIADADSHMILLNSLIDFPNFKEEHFDEYKYEVKRYINSLLLGYTFSKKNNKYNIPLKDYLDEIDKLGGLEKIDPMLEYELEFYEDYSIEDRMKYGFYITKSDVKRLNKKYIPKAQ